MLLNMAHALLLLATPFHQGPPPSKPPMLFLSTKVYHDDRPGSGSSASGKTLWVNHSTPFATYTNNSMCGFAAGGFTEIDPGAQLGWNVLVIPKAVKADVVVLTVTWTRERSHKVEERGSTELMMRPGDVVPLDVAETPEKRPGCHITSAELDLELDPVEWAKETDGNASLVSTDMWLVRRLPNGQDQTEQLNVRGALNEEVPFYFTDLKSGDLLLSVFGKIRARARDSGGIAIEFSAARYLTFPTTAMERGFTTLPPRSGPLVFDSDQEVVSVEFPLSTNPNWKDLGSQPLSIRIKTRRIR